VRPKPSEPLKTCDFLLVEDDILSSFCQSFESVFRSPETPPGAGLALLRVQAMRAMSILLSSSQHARQLQDNNRTLFSLVIEPLCLRDRAGRLLVVSRPPSAPNTDTVTTLGLRWATSLTATFLPGSEVRGPLEHVSLLRHGSRTKHWGPHERYSGSQLVTPIEIAANRFDLLWHVGQRNEGGGGGGYGSGWRMVIAPSATSGPGGRSSRLAVAETLHDMAAVMDLDLPPPGPVTRAWSLNESSEQKGQDPQGLAGGGGSLSVMRVEYAAMPEDPGAKDKDKLTAELWVKLAGGGAGEKGGATEFPVQLVLDEAGGARRGSTRVVVQGDSIFECTPSLGAGGVTVGGGGGGRGGAAQENGNGGGVAEVMALKTEHMCAALRKHAQDCLSTLVVGWLRDGRDVGLEVFGGDTESLFEILEQLMVKDPGHFHQEILPYLKRKLEVALLGPGALPAFLRVLAQRAVRCLQRRAKEDLQQRVLDKMLDQLFPDKAAAPGRVVTITFESEAAGAAGSLEANWVYLTHGATVQVLREEDPSEESMELSWQVLDVLYERLAVLVAGQGSEGGSTSVLDDLLILFTGYLRVQGGAAGCDVRMVHLLTAVCSACTAVGATDAARLVPVLGEAVGVVRRLAIKRHQAENKPNDSPSKLLKALVQASIVGAYAHASLQALTRAPDPSPGPSAPPPTTKAPLDSGADLWKLVVALRALTDDRLGGVSAPELDYFVVSSLHHDRVALLGLVEKVNTVAKARALSEEAVLAMAPTAVLGDGAPPQLAAALAHLQRVNGLLARALRMVDLDLAPQKWSLPNLLVRVRGFLFTAVKMGVWAQGLKHTDQTKGANETLSLNRHVALPLFSQAFQRLHPMDPLKLRRSDRAYFTKLEGEQGIDDGGLYRQSFVDFCSELQSPKLPYLKEPPSKGTLNMNNLCFGGRDNH
jgi:hypothetical protein